MSRYDDGRLIVPGGKQELKPFKKEMKKLQNSWAIEMSRRYRRIQPSASSWAYLSDEIIDVLVSADTETTMAFILGLAHAQDEAYDLALEATQIMHKHGAAFYQPGGRGTRDPRSFVNESQDIVTRRKEEFENRLARSDEWQRSDDADVPQVGGPEREPPNEGQAPKKVKAISAEPDESEVKLSRRQKRVVDAIGSALDDAAAAYDKARAGDDRIDKSIEILRAAPKLEVFDLALNLAHDLDALYPIGRYRMAWVRAARDGLLRLTVEQQGISEDAAAARLQAVEVEHQIRLGSKPVIWALSAPRDEVVTLLAEVARQLGLEERSSTGTPVEEGDSDPDPSTGERAPWGLEELERVAHLYERGLLTEEEFTKMKARLLAEDAPGTSEQVTESETSDQADYEVSPDELIFWRGVIDADDGDQVTARRRYENAAAMGNAMAMVNLGGLEFEARRLDAARAWFERAASLGEPRAFHNLGVVLEMDGDVEAAEKWLHRAAAEGVSEAMFQIACMRDEAGDVEGRSIWNDKAAAAGHVRAMLNLATRLEGESDSETAEHWYSEAISAGSLDAMVCLAQLKGRVGEQDSKRELLIEATAHGSGEAANELGLMSLEAGQFDAAEQWFSAGADMGHVGAINNLGYVYRENGRMYEAVPLFARAARAGNAEAANSIAEYHYERGELQDAVRWLRPFWERGEPTVIHNVEVILKSFLAKPDAPESLHGLGIVYVELGDSAKGEQYFERAAAAGNVDSINNLGVLAARRGDKEAARRLFTRAASAGDPAGRENLRRLEER